MPVGLMFITDKQRFDNLKYNLKKPFWLFFNTCIYPVVGMLQLADCINSKFFLKVNILT
jgi:hypothetical protein